MHRIRQRLIRDRTSLVNQIRGMLAEYGLILNRSYRVLKTKLPELIEDMSNQLTFNMRDLLSDMHEELKTNNQRIEKKIEQRLELFANQQHGHQLLMDIPGIGLLTASALISQIGDAKQFRSARGLAAWLGLTPKHQASGTKITNQGISKRGDRYLRTFSMNTGGWTPITPN